MSSASGGVCFVEHGVVVRGRRSAWHYLRPSSVVDLVWAVLNVIVLFVQTLINPLKPVETYRGGSSRKGNDGGGGGGGSGGSDGGGGGKRPMGRVNTRGEMACPAAGG
eukprot:TRINITY_DN3543_c0_g1_i3.p3 TRINITY_DN3543_c0_g1~~TRINITY_DN3543_c0_g1_i3.p3  ORF type:complete len:123 (-),score=17.63 TRINITY_DN3543_c0_g1_i3:251-574(-)